MGYFFAMKIVDGLAKLRQNCDRLLLFAIKMAIIIIIQLVFILLNELLKRYPVTKFHDDCEGILIQFNLIEVFHEKVVVKLFKHFGFLQSHIDVHRFLLF